MRLSLFKASTLSVLLLFSSVGETAVRFDAAADRLLRTANLPNESGTYTVTFWVRVTTLAGNYETFCTLNDDATINWVGLNVDGALTVYKNLGDEAGTIFTAGTWYFVAIRHGNTANTLEVFLDGGTTANKTVTEAVSFVQSRFEFMGRSSSDIQPSNGRIAAIKWWDSALSVADMQQERWTYRPKRTTNLQGWYPCLNTGEDEIDFSGNARTFTVGGTLATEDGPPISW